MPWLVVAVAIFALLAAAARPSAAVAGDVAWTGGGAVPLPRRGAATAAAGGKVYLFGGAPPGGLETATVQEYDPVTGGWRARARMPTARFGAAAATLGDGRIFVTGGTTLIWSGPSAVWLKTVEVYDPATDSWSTGAPLPSGRYDHGLVLAPNGRLYAIGGVGGSVDEYDPGSDTWRSRARMLTARTQLGVATATNGRIYAVGGQGTETVVEEYDPTADIWRARARLPTSRLGLALAALGDGRLYAVGGVGGGSLLPTVEAYDPGADAWTRLEDMPLTGGRLAAVAVAHDRMVVVAPDAVAQGTVPGLPPPASTPTPATTPTRPGSYFDMVYDARRDRLYGTDFNGSALAVVAAGTGRVVATVPLGGRAAGVDLRPDGGEVAVALYDAGQIAFVDPDALAVAARVTPAGVAGPNRPWDVAYGRPGRLYSVGNPGSEGRDFIHVYDTATRAELGRSWYTPGMAPRLAITGDGSTIYVAEPDGSPDYVARVDARGDPPELVAQTTSGTVTVETLAVQPDGARLYTSTGESWAPGLKQPMTRLDGGVADVRVGQQVEYVPARGRVYVSAGARVFELDPRAAAVARTFATTGAAGVARADASGKRLFVSTDSGVAVWHLDGARTLLPLLHRR